MLSHRWVSTHLARSFFSFSDTARIPCIVLSAERRFGPAAVELAVCSFSSLLLTTCFFFKPLCTDGLLRAAVTPFFERGAQQCPWRVCPLLEEPVGCVSTTHWCSLIHFFCFAYFVFSFSFGVCTDEPLSLFGSVVTSCSWTAPSPFALLLIVSFSSLLF